MNSYQIKKIPEDFEVFEIEDFECFSHPEFDYHYYYLSKLGYTTFEATEYISKHHSIPIDEIGYSGLKDEDGVTAQYISLPVYIDNLKIEEFNVKHRCETKNYINIKYHGSGKEPLKISKLRGNYFRLRIRNLTKNVCASISKNPAYSLFFVNYYGSQRFGLPSQIKNTHLIGKSILEKNYKNALIELSKQNSEIGKAALEHKKKPEFFFNTIDQRKMAFFQSAYYSYLWNQKIIYYFDKMDFSCFNMSLDDINYKFICNEKDILLFLKNHPKFENRRIIHENNSFFEDIYERNTIIQTELNIENIDNDEINTGKYFCQLTFYLPSGCYATIAIPQFMQQFIKHEEAVKNAQF